jgi:peptidoglycan hydrolase-like protein with peptidoglycan-binding domain
MVTLLAGCAASRSLPPGTVRPAADRILTAGDIQVAQENLRAFGFDPEPVNGRFTAETQAAVRAYQGRYGMEVTGLLDRATRRELLPGEELIAFLRALGVPQERIAGALPELRRRGNVSFHPVHVSPEQTTRYGL